jgi:hypothetical protein
MLTGFLFIQRLPFLGVVLKRETEVERMERENIETLKEDS